MLREIHKGLALTVMTLSMAAPSAFGQAHYAFSPTDYTATDDSRAPQSAFSYTDSTFTIKATGQNNIAFKMGEECDDKYYINADDTWFVVSGKGLKNGAADAYVWWMNGWNKGSQVAADYTCTDGDRQIFVWNLKGGNELFAGFDFTQDNTVLYSNSTGYIIAMGLTAKSGVGVVDGVGFYSSLTVSAAYPALKAVLGISDESLISSATEKIDALIESAEKQLENRPSSEEASAALRESVDHAKAFSKGLTAANIADAPAELEALQKALDAFIEATRVHFYTKTSNGLTATLDDLCVDVQFVSESTIRVTKRKSGADVPSSLVVIQQPDTSTVITYTEAADSIVMESGKARVVYDSATGKIRFYRPSGEAVINEKTASVTPTKDGPNDSYKLAQSFSISDDEQIYGLGQVQNGRLSMRGTSMSMIQDNRSIYIPYFYSSRHYGLYWDNYSPTQFSDSKAGATFKSTGDAIDYYVLIGESSDEVLRSLRQLTGETQLPPLWNFGLYQSKQRYQSAQEVIDVVKKYRELRVPLDCVVQDWQYWGNNNHWNAMEFLNTNYADYQRMIGEVHNMNSKLMISVWANFGPSTDQYKEFGDAGRLIPIQSYPTDVATRPYDVYSQSTRDRYWDYLYKGIMSKGIDALWLDSSEPDDFSNKTTDYDYVTGLDGRTFRSLRNAFPLCHVEGVYDHHLAQTELSGKRTSILTRSAYAGMQRTGAFVWSADITASWECLANQIPAACNFSVSGLPYWNSDTGGFFLGDFSGGVNNERWRRLYTRWTQFSAFCPMMRFHGDQTPREIWQFGDKGDAKGDYDNILRYIKLRYHMLPYLYSTAYETTSQSSTFMRALPIAFESDPGCVGVADQYMFGRSMMVAPVVTESTSHRNVYLPATGLWYDFWTGQPHEGGQTISRETPEDIIPLYVRAGSILPWGPDVQYSGEKQWDSLEVRIYAGADGKFTLYEDELDGYGYKQGKCAEIPFAWDEQSQTLTIGERKGAFDGMLRNRVFRIVRVSSTKGNGDALSSKCDTTVSYDGTAQEIKIAGSTTTVSQTDITSENMVNPSFEDNGTTLTKTAPQGWTVSANTAWWGVNQGGGNGDPEATDGKFIFGVWDGSATQTPEISQTIYSLPEGTYRLTVDMQASNRSNTSIRLGNQCIFAGDAVSFFKDNVSTAGTGDTYPLQPLSVTFSVKQDKADVRIGVRTSEAPNETWFKIDNFRLYRMSGVDDTETSIRLTTDDTPAPHTGTYDMSGRRVADDALSHGIYIIDGKKVLK